MVVWFDGFLGITKLASGFRPSGNTSLHETLDSANNHTVWPGTVRKGTNKIKICNNGDLPRRLLTLQQIRCNSYGGKCLPTVLTAFAVPNRIFLDFSLSDFYLNKEFKDESSVFSNRLSASKRLSTAARVAAAANE